MEVSWTCSPFFARVRGSNSTVRVRSLWSANSLPRSTLSRTLYSPPSQESSALALRLFGVKNSATFVFVRAEGMWPSSLRRIDTCFL